MSDFFWSTQNPNGQDVRCEGGEIVHVQPKSMSAIAGNAGNFVWEPGAVQQGNVFNNWPDLAAAIAALPGQKSVTVVTDLGAAHVTTGTYAGIQDVTFVAGGKTGVLALVHIDEGAHFTFPAASATRMSFDGIGVDVQNTTAAVIALSGAQTIELFFRNASSLAVSGSKAFVDFSGTSQMVCWVESDSLIETGSADPFNVSGGTPTLDFFAFTGGVLQQSIIAASGGAGPVAFVVDGSSQALVSTLQSIAPVVTVLDPQPTFVFRPGGVAGGNVFTTWTALAQAVALTPGPRTILVDDSLSAAHMTAGSGAWDLDNTTLVGNALANETLIIDVGATFTSSSLRLKNGLILQNHATSTPWTAGVFFEFLLEDPGTAAESIVGAAPLLTVGAGGNNGFIQVGSGTRLGDGTHNVVTVPATGTIISYLQQAGSVQSHAYAGLGTVTQNYAATTPSTPQDVTTFTLAYSGFVNQVQQTGNTGTGTHTVTVTTGNIKQQKTGKVMVTGSCAGATAAADAITATLVRDVAAGNVAIATQTVTTTAGQLNYVCSFAFLDTLPDTATHTYSIRLAGAQNNTVAANQGIVTAIEQ